jgi:hypothetical protein
VTRFDVATSAADEGDPAVFATGGGFLIAYEKVIGGQRSIVWRTVSFPSRRRAVRR